MPRPAPPLAALLLALALGGALAPSGCRAQVRTLLDLHVVVTDLAARGDDADAPLDLGTGP